MRIKAYECSICKALTRDEHVYELSTTSYSFTVEKKTFIAEYRDSACSTDCVKAALDAWLVEQKRAEKPEVKNIVLDGIQVI